MKGFKMNAKQIVGLGIMVPLFSLAVGHTVINKIYKNKENEITENINQRNYVYKENLYRAIQKVDSLQNIILNTNKEDTQKLKELCDELKQAQKELKTAQSEI